MKNAARFSGAQGSLLCAVLIVAAVAFAACEGPTGPKGEQGISINWQGEYPSAAALLAAKGVTTPGANWAYYNTEEGTSYIWNAATRAWEILAIDGGRGSDGRPVRFFRVNFDLDGGEIAGRTGTFYYNSVENAPAIMPPTPSRSAGEPQAAGFYRSTADGHLSDLFIGWYLDPSKHDGDDREWVPTYDLVEKEVWLKARYTSSEPISEVGTDSLDDAFTYVMTHTGTYLMMMTGGTTGNKTLTATKTVGSGANLIIAALDPMEINSSTAIEPGLTSGVGRLFTLNLSNSTLTIGNNITLRGIAGASKPMVRVENGATFVMNAGSAITGHTNILYWGAETYENKAGTGTSAVFVSGGSFTMRGGTISGNTSSGAASAGYGITPHTGGAYVGGAVTLVNSGRFTMIDGSITGNSNTYNRATAVNVINGIFTMSGGSITNNTAGASSTYTAAVFVNGGNNNARFVMTGGDISGNTSAAGPRHDVLIYSEAAGTGRITLSGNPTIGQLTINAFGAAATPTRNTVNIASPGMTGGNITLNLRGEVGSHALTQGLWANGAELLKPAVASYTLKPADVAVFNLGNTFYNAAAAQAVPAGWIIAANGTLSRQ